MAVDELEAFAVLRDMAFRREEAIPADVLAQHVLAVTEGADWPVVEAAMKALRRRRSFAARDELGVASRPGGRQRLGAYTTRVPGKGGERPYRTWLMSVDPIVGSCSCPDYARSSLGLCKHLIVVLQDVYASDRKLGQAQREGARSPASPLAWDPVRPLHGAGDWLTRLRWDPTRKRSLTRAETRAKAAFRKSGDLKSAPMDDLPRRKKLVDLLLAAAESGEAEPAVEALLQREQAKLGGRMATHRLSTTTRWTKGLHRSLYPYQLEGVQRFLATGRLLLGDDMGLGKTTQAVAACHALLGTGHVERGLIITPASLKWQWLREWQAMTDEPATIVEGSPAERRALYEGLERGFLILNYELLLRDGDALRAMNVDIAVLDEAQRIKNWATKTAAVVKSLRVPHRLVLTGTPMENRLEELASIYDWVDDLALEPKWRLVPHHSLTVQEGGRGEVIGARHLDTLRARIAPTFLRRVRREVLRQLPPRTETRVPVPLTDEQRVEHSDLDRPIAQLINISNRRPLRQSEFLRLMSLLTRQRVICNGIAQLEFETFWPALPVGGPQSDAQLHGLFAPKLEELRRLIEELVIDQGRKVIVFSQWRRMLRLAHWAIAGVLADAGQRAVFFTGAESTGQRTRGVVELHDDPAATVMFLSDAGGVGLNLQRAASACINLELPWNPAVLEQRVSRIYRIGQTDPVEIYNLVAEEGIEARIQTVVATKRELFEGLFDGTSDEIMFSGTGSGMAQIQQIVDVPQEAAPAPADEDDFDEILPPAPVEPAPVVVPRDGIPVQQLLSSLSVRSTPEGGVVLEAPPESAQALASLFGAMAELLEQQAPK